MLIFWLMLDILLDTPRLFLNNPVVVDGDARVLDADVGEYHDV